MENLASGVQYVERTIKTPKELTEVGDLVLSLVYDAVVQKKKLPAALVENYEKFLKAGEGLDKVPAEAKDVAVRRWAANFANDLADLLLAKKS